MSASQLNAYRQTGRQETVHPVKLVHMVYERILTHLDLSEEGIRGNEPKKRGENLGKAIALISELHSSVNEKNDSEAAIFLRGLYESILLELSKVSVSGDLQVIAQARNYIVRLKEIWEETAMHENGFDVRAQGENIADDAVAPPTGAGGGNSDVQIARLSVSI